MELFGALFGLPVAALISAFYPKLAFKICERSRFLTAALLVVSSFIAFVVLTELGLIFFKGVAAAHDNFKPYFDLLHTGIVLLGPTAITNLFVLWLWRRKANFGDVNIIVGIVCFCAIIVAFTAHIFYDSAAHSRTDSEGTYRIQE